MLILKTILKKLFPTAKATVHLLYKIAVLKKVFHSRHFAVNIANFFRTEQYLSGRLSPVLRMDSFTYNVGETIHS